MTPEERRLLMTLETMASGVWHNRMGVCQKKGDGAGAEANAGYIRAARRLVKRLTETGSDDE